MGKTDVRVGFHRLFYTWLGNDLSRSALKVLGPITGLGSLRNVPNVVFPQPRPELDRSLTSLF